jgi:hydrogenase expression/formation protein HypC
MCLAIPGKLIEVAEEPHGLLMGKANFGGIVKQVCLQYVPEAVPGDYVLVHVGFALGKIDEAEARRTYEALAELQQLADLETPDFPEDPDPFLAAPAAPNPPSPP